MPDEFTSPDPRLRPQHLTAPAAQPAGPPEYPVDETNFPALADAFASMQSAAGLQGYRLVVLGDDFAGAGTDFDRKLIGIGARRLNRQPFEAIIGTIGHELGHAYRQKHPEAPLVGAPIAGLTPQRMEEIEADRIGICLAGAASSIEALRTGGVTLDPGLPVHFRIDAAEHFSPASCPVGGPSKYSGIKV